MARTAAIAGLAVANFVVLLARDPFLQPIFAVSSDTAKLDKDRELSGVKTMSQHANLTQQIHQCLNELQHTVFRRRQIQSALVQQLQIPLLLLGGICLGIFFHTTADGQATRTSMSAQFTLWLLRLWLGRPTAAPVVSTRKDNQ